MFTFLERYLSRMSGKSMPVDLDAVKPFMGFCTAIMYTNIHNPVHHVPCIVIINQYNIDQYQFLYVHGTISYPDAPCRGYYIYLHVPLDVAIF